MTAASGIPCVDQANVERLVIQNDEMTLTVTPYAYPDDREGIKIIEATGKVLDVADFKTMKAVFVAIRPGQGDTPNIDYAKIGGDNDGRNPEPGNSINPGVRGGGPERGGPNNKGRGHDNENRRTRRPYEVPRFTKQRGTDAPGFTGGLDSAPRLKDRPEAENVNALNSFKLVAFHVGKIAEHLDRLDQTHDFTGVELSEVMDIYKKSAQNTETLRRFILERTVK